MTPRRRAGAGLIVSVGAVLATVWGPAPPAQAHAVLLTTDPPSGAALPAAPHRIAVTFDEPVTVVDGSVAIVDATGRRFETGTVDYADGARRVTLGVRDGMPAGSYAASWKTISADTHVIGGSIVFGVGEQPVFGTAALAAAPVPDPPAEPARVLAGWLLYAGIALTAGAGLVLARLRGRLLAPRWAGQRRVGQLLWAGWWLLVLGSAGDVLARLSAAGVAGVAAGASGAVLVARLVAVTAAAVLLTRWRVGRPAAFAARTAGRGSGFAPVGAVAAVLAGTVAAAGHAATGSDAPVALLATAVHVLAMSVWLGGLALLALGRPVADVLPEWSRIATVAVLSVVASGVYQAVRAVGSWPALWSTGYGRLLLAKIVLVGFALAVAAGARRRGRGRPGGPPAPVTGGARAAGRPAGTGPAAGPAPGGRRRRVLVEIAVGIIVLGLTATLAVSPPARTGYAPPVTATVGLGPLRAAVTVDRAATGPQELRVRVTDAAGAPVRLESLTAALSQDSAGLGPYGVVLRPDYARPIGNVLYEYVSVALAVPAPGEWTLELTATPDRFTAYVGDLRYPVAG